jgi:hypothetical protein
MEHAEKFGVLCLTMALTRRYGSATMIPLTHLIY